MKQKQYQMEIRIPDPLCPKEKVWLVVKSSRGIVYQYDTKEEADRMLRMCYGDKLCASDMRVVAYNPLIT